MEFRQGDILRGNPDKVNHPIIYWDAHDDQHLFIGLAMTHMKKGNMLLKDEHFEEQPEDDRNSFFVRRLLIKPMDWGDFEKVGSLSKEGINHIKENLITDEPVFWEQALREYKAQLA